MLHSVDFHAYQHTAVDFVKSTPKCALWLDMGLGKTSSTLTAIRELLDSADVGRALVVAPLRVAVSTWPAELTKWEQLDGLTVKVIRGTPKQRVEQLLHDRSDIHVINRELVTWLVDTIQKHPEFKKRRAWAYDTVVIDESSSFKDHASKRFKALRKTIPATTRLVELTGTAAGNGYRIKVEDAGNTDTFAEAPVFRVQGQLQLTRPELSIAGVKLQVLLTTLQERMF